MTFYDTGNFCLFVSLWFFCNDFSRKVRIFYHKAYFKTHTGNQVKKAHGNYGVFYFLFVFINILFFGMINAY